MFVVLNVGISTTPITLFREDNERLVAWLNDRADVEGLPLSARVADPGDRFEKIHAKGAVVDGERVIMGSLNWNNNSARANREVVLVLEGSEVGAYYLEVFDADWDGPSPDVPLGMVAVLILVVLAAFLAARAIDFESDFRETD
jgi:Phosphatidylserine/phosphatidylglycerophosphate/cardiolipin synthases and related enzymes